MKVNLLILISLLVLSGCSKSDWHEDYEVLKLRYNGKYELLSSYSDEAVDLNMDGVYSTYLPAENPEIERAALIIKIIPDDRTTESGKHIFDEMWPDAHVVHRGEEVSDTARHQDSYFIMYAMKLHGCRCQFVDNNATILLDEPYLEESSALISFDSIDVDENGIITLVTRRKLYTNDGWVETQITSKYKRYTTHT
ncbi:hypothetical protein [uncultured Draconibacterium sp.]|uniref:hypothetical protein n=1 Tax=uncultured Draconibacterium sp. TaxID=1573823 RepID=UPI002AA65F42|nr:hypothetical protein [uncultured Draconibacterium sp.]